MCGTRGSGGGESLCVGERTSWLETGLAVTAVVSEIRASVVGERPFVIPGYIREAEGTTRGDYIRGSKTKTGRGGGWINQTATKLLSYSVDVVMMTAKVLA